MATLTLWAIMVTDEEVEDLAEAVRGLGHEVSIEPPPWEPYGHPPDKVLEWLATPLKPPAVAEIVAATQAWGRAHWTSRWRPRQLASIGTRGRHYAIEFAD